MTWWWILFFIIHRELHFKGTRSVSSIVVCLVNREHIRCSVSLLEISCFQCQQHLLWFLNHEPLVLVNRFSELRIQHRISLALIQILLSVLVIDTKVIIKIMIRTLYVFNMFCFIWTEKSVVRPPLRPLL